MNDYMIPSSPVVKSYYTLDLTTNRISKDTSGLRKLRPLYSRMFANNYFDSGLKFDLLQGYTSRNYQLNKISLKQNFSSLLQHLCDEAKNIKVNEYDFITTRGTLDEIIVHRSMGKDLSLIGQKFNGSIYLEYYWKPNLHKREMIRSKDPRSFNALSQFKKLISAPFDDGHEGGNEKCFFTVLSNKIGENHIIYNSKIKATVSDKVDLMKSKNYVELAIRNFTPYPSGSSIRREKEHLFWSAATSNIGSQKVICAFISSDYIVKQIDILTPQYMEQNTLTTFNLYESRMYLNSILEKMKNIMLNMNESTVVQIQLTKNGNLNEPQVFSQNENAKEFKDLNLLTSDFIEHLSK